MKTARKVFRQGDCLLHETKQKLGLHITAGTVTAVMGETGNPHIVQGSKIIQTMTGRQVVLVEPEDQGSITHATHEKISIPHGSYDVTRTRSYQARDRQINRFSD